MSDRDSTISTGPRAQVPPELEVHSMPRNATLPRDTPTAPLDPRPPSAAPPPRDARALDEAHVSPSHAPDENSTPSDAPRADETPGTGARAKPRLRLARLPLPRLWSALRFAPLYERELHEMTEGTAAPVAWLGLVVLATFTTAGIGATFQAFTNPERVGALLFQVFFSAAYFLVVLVGTALGASAIASERDAETWDALVLTPLPLRSIVRDKLAAAFTKLALFALPLMPIAGLATVLGDVSPVELVLSELDLLLIGAVAVAGGLAIGARSRSVGAAVVAALACAGLAAPAGYFASFTASFIAHQVWPAVPRLSPAWLPIAQHVAAVDASYVVFLWMMPLALSAIAIWFFFEAAVTATMDEAGDRTIGLKRWFTVSMPLLAGMGLLAVYLGATDPADRSARLIDASGVLTCVWLWGAIVLAAEPAQPLARAISEWQRRGRRPLLAAAFAPGVFPTATLVLAVGLASLGGLLGAGSLLVAAGQPSRDAALRAAGAACLPGQVWAGFLVFAVGLGAWIDTVLGHPLTTRICLLATLGAACLAPLFAQGPLVLLARSAAAGAWTQPSPLVPAVKWLPLLSPLFAGQLGAAAAGPHAPELAVAAFIAAATWIVLGIMLLGMAALRLRGHSAASVGGGGFRTNAQAGGGGGGTGPSAPHPTAASSP